MLDISVVHNIIQFVLLHVYSNDLLTCRELSGAIFRNVLPVQQTSSTGKIVNSWQDPKTIVSIIFYICFGLKFYWDSIYSGLLSYMISVVSLTVLSLKMVGKVTPRPSILAPFLGLLALPRIQPRWRA
jgi:hypothetical protein